MNRSSHVNLSHNDRSYAEAKNGEEFEVNRPEEMVNSSHGVGRKPLRQ